MRPSLAAVVALAVAPAAPADVTDVADLFPADTLAFVELHRPGEAAAQLAAAFKATALEDGVRWVHDRKDRAKDFREFTGKPELAALGLLTSPEMFAELARVRGAAVALTGVDDAGRPHVSLAVLTGDSPAAGLAARAFLTMTPHMRRAGTVGGVPFFQVLPTTVGVAPNGQPQVPDPKPADERPGEPVYAYLPGLFVAASHKEAAADVLARFRGAGKGGPLRANPLFVEAGPQRKPGAFGYVNPPLFAARLDAAHRAAGEGDGELFALFRLAANPQAFRVLSAHLAVRDGGLSLAVSGLLKPGETSPLADLVAGSGATVEVLHPAPAGTAAAVAVVPPKANRAAALLGFADALAKANGWVGRRPGEAVREAEARLKLSIADGLLGRTASVLVAVPSRQELPKGATPLPLLVLVADDEKTAEGYEACVRAVAADLSGAAAEPFAETVGGRRVYSLPGAGLPWNAPVHFARAGTRFAVGLDRTLVAAAVAADPAGSMAAGAAVPSAAGDAGLVGAVSLGRWLKLSAAGSAAGGPVVPVPENQPVPNPGGPNAVAPPDPAKAAAGLYDAAAGLPPATVSARRTATELRVDVWQPGLSGGRWADVVLRATDWFDQVVAAGQRGRSRFSRFGE